MVDGPIAPGTDAAADPVAERNKRWNDLRNRMIVAYLEGGVRDARTLDRIRKDSRPRHGEVNSYEAGGILAGEAASFGTGVADALFPQLPKPKPADEPKTEPAPTEAAVA